MGRNDLEERSLQQGLKIGDAKGGKGCPREVEGKGTDCPPPWTKYLLDEGLDSTKTFSRYKGVFAGEKGLLRWSERSGKRGESLATHKQTQPHLSVPKAQVNAHPRFSDDLHTPPLPPPPRLCPVWAVPLCPKT